MHSFEDFKEKPSGFRKFTGLANLNVLAINPTKDQLVEFCGISEDVVDRFNTTYAKTDNFGEGNTRPIAIWFGNEDVLPFSVTIDISNRDVKYNPSVKNPDGTFQITNDHLNDAKASSIQKIIDNPNMTKWFTLNGIRKAKQGEILWYTIVRALIGTHPEFTKAVVENKVDIDTIWDGDYDGLHALAEYARTSEKSLVALMTIREKVTDDGVKTYQEILRNSDIIYPGSKGVLPAHVADLKKKEAKKEADGYSLTKRFYTYEFQEYNKTDCVNFVDLETVVETPVIGGRSL